MQVEVTANGAFVPLNGQRVYFNAFWLRDADPANYHPDTRETVYNLADAPEPRIKEAVLDGGHLLLHWQDEDHITRLDLTMLAEAAEHGGRPDVADLPRNLWKAGHSAAFTRLRQADVLSQDEARAAFCRALIVDGIAVVTDMEDSEESVERLIWAVGPPTRTVDGEFFDVRVQLNPVNAAFTSGHLALHTDLPSEETAPGIQFLHCRENSAKGGMSLFMDGAAAAEQFRRDDPDGFALLSQHAISFRRVQASWDYRSRQTVIELDHRGEVSGLTVNQHLKGAIDLPQAVLDQYYPAYRRFAAMMNDARYLNRFRLQPGECIVFDNHRVLHGREAYEPSSGGRHLRGGYTDRAAMKSTYRTVMARMAGGQHAA